MKVHEVQPIMDALYAEKCENVLDELRKYLTKCKMFRKGLEEEIKEKKKKHRQTD